MEYSALSTFGEWAPRADGGVGMLSEDWVLGWNVPKINILGACG
jgi:hypothetical protein